MRGGLVQGGTLSLMCRRWLSGVASVRRRGALLGAWCLAWNWVLGDKVILPQDQYSSLTYGGLAAGETGKQADLGAGEVLEASQGRDALPIVPPRTPEEFPSREEQAYDLARINTPETRQAIAASLRTIRLQSQTGSEGTEWDAARCETEFAKYLLRLVGGFPPKEALPVLAEFCESPNSEVRRSAYLHVLVLMRDNPSGPIFAQVLRGARSSDPCVRRYFVEDVWRDVVPLGGTGAVVDGSRKKVVVTALKQLLEDNCANVQACALLRLFEANWPAVGEEACRRLSDRSRITVYDGPNGIDDCWQMRCLAARILGRMRDPKWADALRKGRRISTGDALASRIPSQLHGTTIARLCVADGELAGDLLFEVECTVSLALLGNPDALELFVELSDQRVLSIVPWVMDSTGMRHLADTWRGERLLRAAAEKRISTWALTRVPEILGPYRKAEHGSGLDGLWDAAGTERNGEPKDNAARPESAIAPRE